jgi:hypothetical protein
LRGTGEIPTDTDYRLRFDGVTATLARASLGRETVMLVRPWTPAPGAWSNVAVRAVGGRIDVSLDGHPLLRVLDPEPLPGGLLALGCVNGKDVAFDDVEVVPGAASPPPTEAGTTTVFRESFDAPADPVGWVLLPGARVARVGGKGHLSCRDLGHAFCYALLPTDFAMRLRYLHTQGTGQVLFRVTASIPNDTNYRIRFDGATAVLARAEAGVETVLASAPLALTIGSWHDVIVRMDGPAITAYVDGAKTLTATDPVPLPNGAMAFGCILGKDTLFDEIEVVSGHP